MLRHWRGAGASDQRERGNAADTHAVSLIERELPLATYLERFHPSVLVRGSQIFVFLICVVVQYRRKLITTKVITTKLITAKISRSTVSTR